MVKQIKSTSPAFFLEVEELPQLEDLMEMNRRQIWAHKKLHPEQDKNVFIEDGCSTDYNLFNNTRKIVPLNETCKNTWSILHLVWGRLIDHAVTVLISTLKDPRQAVPVDTWKDFIEDDAGLFPVRVKDLVDAFTLLLVQDK